MVTMVYMVQGWKQCPMYKEDRRGAFTHRPQMVVLDDACMEYPPYWGR